MTTSSPAPLPRKLLLPSLLAVVFSAPAIVLLGLAFGFDPVRYEGERRLAHREDGFVGAAACLACHPDQHASWQRTWHSTMTQRVSRATIRGDFHGKDVELCGAVFKPSREGDRFLIELPIVGDPAVGDPAVGDPTVGDPTVGDPSAAAAKTRVAEVAFAVGSHRYQQYFERVDQPDGGAVHRRLPILWHMEDQRWHHVNGIFLSPDSTEHSAGAIWDQNCIFCHNTGPRPGIISGQRRGESSSFDARVADLGIACESCHGPGAKHADAMRDPMARYRSYSSGGSVEHDAAGRRADMHIVDPGSLDKERRVSLCGQCHGQRLPKELSSIGEILKTGPSFRSGDRLLDHVQPLAPTTSVPGREETFGIRFWGDGTPRLTAYEYQGVTASPCYQRGEMTCGSCHSMHGSEEFAGRDDMVTRGKRGNAACVQCHEEIGRDISAHTQHASGSSGSDCMACHMPKIVYGVLGVRRGHKVENPDPIRDAKFSRPHACTMCHVDKSLAWSGREMQRMFGDRYGVPSKRGDGAEVEVADAVASLLSGDAVVRAVYANAAGDAVAGNSTAELALHGEIRLALIATLADSYPSIRHIARNSLVALEASAPIGVSEELRRFDARSIDPARRKTAVNELIAAFARRASSRLRAPPRPVIVGADLRPRMRAVIRLLNLQSKKVISIGE